MLWLQKAVREVLRQWKSNELSYAQALSALGDLGVADPAGVLERT